MAQKDKPQNSTTDKPWQVGDSSAGISSSDIHSMMAIPDPQRSGAQQSAINDANAYEDLPVDPAYSGGENQDNADALNQYLSNKPKPGTSLSDAQAGYDQAAFDEQVDSAAETGDPEFDSLVYHSQHQTDPAFFDRVVKENSDQIDALRENLSDEQNARIDQALERAGWKKGAENEPMIPPGQEKSLFQKAMDLVVPDAGANADVPNRGPASELPPGKAELNDLKANGYSDSDIALYRKDTENTLREEGATEEDIKAYFGDPEYDPKPMQAIVSKAEAWHPPMAPQGNDTTTKEAHGIQEAFQAGIQGSVSGLVERGKLPDLTTGPNTTLTETVAHAAGQLIGDAPAMWLGAKAWGMPVAAGVSLTAGPEAGVPLGFAAGLFGMGAVPAVVRQGLMDYYKSGQVKDPHDFVDRMIREYAQAGKDGVVNLITGLAGKLGGGKMVSGLLSKVESQAGKAAISKVGSLALEVPSAVVSQAVTELRLPTMDDFEHAGATIAALHVMSSGIERSVDYAAAKGKLAAVDRVTGYVKENLSKIYRETGMHPADVTAIAENDPTLQRELVQVFDKVPRSLEWALGKPRTSSPDTVQLELLPEQPELIARSGEKGPPGTKALYEAAPKQTAVVKSELPDSLGGGEVQTEFDYTPQGDLGLKGQAPYDPATPKGIADGSMPSKQGELVPMGSKDGSVRTKGEQLSLGTDGEIKPHPGQGELPISGGKVFDRTNPLWAEQQSLGIKETHTLGEQGDLGLDGRPIQGELNPPDGPYSGEKKQATLTGFSEDGSTPGGPKSQIEALTPEQLDKISTEEAHRLVRSQIKPSNHADPSAIDVVRQAPNALKKAIFDEYDPILRMQKLLTGAKSNKEAIDALPPSMNPYLLLRTLKGAVGKTMVALEHHTYDYATLKENGEGLRKILKPFTKDAAEAGKFEEYMTAARHIELGLSDREGGMPHAAALKVYTEGQAKYGEIAKRVVDFQNRILKLAVDSGVKSQEEYDAMVKSGQHYVPFKRVFEGEAPAGFGGGFAAVDKLKKLVGSNRAIISPYESIARKTHEMILMSERNRIMRSMRDLMKIEPDRVDTGEEVTIDGEKATQYKELGPNEIGVFEDGKRQVFKVDKEVAGVIRGLDESNFDMVTKILSHPAGWLRFGATQTPQFIIKNVIRDQIHAFMVSDNGYIPFVDYLRGFASMAKKDEAFLAWMKGGGMNATIQSLDTEYLSKNIVKLQSETGFMKTAQNVVKSGFQLIPILRHLSEYAEVPTRIGEFKKARGNNTGIDSTIGAAYDARNITLDFQRRGAQSAALNAVIPFFNAKNQGIQQIKELFQEKPGEMVVKGGAMALASAALWAINHKDPRHKEAAGWEKALFWNFHLDKWVPAMRDEEDTPMSRQKADGSWEVNVGESFKIPKPQEIGIMFASSVEYALDAFYAHDKEAGEALKQAIIDQIVPDAPLATKVYSEIQHNYSDFLQRDIVPREAQGLLPHMQFGPSTSPAAKYLSKFMYEHDLEKYVPIPAPAKTDYAVKGIFGSLPGTAADLIAVGNHVYDKLNYTIEKLGGKIPDEVSDMDWKGLNFVKAFDLQVPQQSLSIERFFHTFREDVKPQIETYKKVAQSDPKEAAIMEGKDDFKVARLMAGPMADYQTQMKNLQKASVGVSTIPDMSRDEGYRATVALMWRRAQIAAKAMKEYRAAQKAVKEGADVSGGIPDLTDE